MTEKEIKSEVRRLERLGIDEVAALDFLALCDLDLLQVTVQPSGAFQASSFQF